MVWINLASQGLLFPHGATAKTLVPSGHVNPQILGVIQIAASIGTQGGVVRENVSEK
jgi:hypothetical protein